MVTDKEILAEADKRELYEESPYSRYTAFVEGAKWMQNLIKTREINDIRQ